jgi:hypothetical protein
LSAGSSVSYSVIQNEPGRHHLPVLRQALPPHGRHQRAASVQTPQVHRLLEVQDGEAHPSGQQVDADQGREADGGFKVSKKPHYIVTTTLLGGLDINRRSIHRYHDHKLICVFNQWMDEWTPEHERLLKICLDALNEDAKQINA